MSRQNRPDTAQANDDDGGVEFLDFLRSAGGTVPLAHDRSPSQQNQQQRQSNQGLVDSLSHRRSTPYFSHSGRPQHNRHESAGRNQSSADSSINHRSARHQYQAQQLQHPQSSSETAERKRRHTGLEHARRTHPHSGCLQVARHSGGSGASRSSSHHVEQVGFSVDDAIDLTSSSPPSRQPTRPGHSRMDSNNGNRGSGIAQALAAQRQRRQDRMDADNPLPPWQPDDDASQCPVCNVSFSWSNRRHHCRKCGRVVCGQCSPHRITIPRQYIVHPPEHQHLYASYTDGQAPMDSSNPALGGGEVVRVCNPCVPDPWRPGRTPERYQKPSPTIPSTSITGTTITGTGTTFTGTTLRPQLPLRDSSPISPMRREDFETSEEFEAYLEAIDPARDVRTELPWETRAARLEATRGPQDPFANDVSFRNAMSNLAARVPVPSRNRAMSAQQIRDLHQPPIIESSHLFASSAEFDRPANSDAYYEWRQRPTGNTNHPLFNPENWTPPPHAPPFTVEQAEADHRALMRRIDMDRQARDRARIPAGEEFMQRAHPTNPPFRNTGAVHSALRRNTAHSTVPPRPQIAEEDECPVCGEEMAPGEGIREAHIEACIASRLAPRSPPGIPPAIPGDSPAEASRPRAASHRPRGLAKSVATEKDCVESDGTARECPTCMEEYVPGDELLRMECMCVYHAQCIRDWFAKKGAAVCPLHMVYE